MKKGGLAARALRLALGLAALAALGCSSYVWRPAVPASYRTVSVPTFRNESNVTELGSVMTRQLLREFQREGTFEIRRAGDAALEVQGVVRNSSSTSGGYDRRTGLRLSSYDFTATVLVSVIDKRNGRVLVDNRPYRVSTTYTAAQDLATAERDASGRLAEDLAMRVVDDVVNLKLADGKESGK